MADDAAEILVATTPQQVLDGLKAELGRDGFQDRLDEDHWVSFVARGPNLLVTFEPFADCIGGSETGLPLALDFADEKNWSVLHFAAARETWFRARAIYDFLDEMVDDAFFENFDQVMFYGAGMSGYAAAAFSVVAPGASVLAIRPQATLDTDRAGWDHRYRQARRLRFDDRYGYAPDMLEGAQSALILYDPTEHLDAVHASLFQGPNVTRLKCPHLKDRIELSLREMDLLHRLIESVANRSFRVPEFHRLMRARRGHSRYLHNLLFDLDRQKNPYRTALLCRHVLSRTDSAEFRRRLQSSKEELAAQGRLPEWLQDP